MRGPSFTERYVIARDSNVLRATSRVGGGGWSALLCCQPPPCSSPQVGKGGAPDLVIRPSVVGLDLNPILTRSPST
jgi:hypothetical protein